MISCGIAFREFSDYGDLVQNSTIKVSFVRFAVPEELVFRRKVDICVRFAVPEDLVY
jgi:hypothetical protein